MYPFPNRYLVKYAPSCPVTPKIKAIFFTNDFYNYFYAYFVLINQYHFYLNKNILNNTVLALMSLIIIIPHQNREKIILKTFQNLKRQFI